MFSKKEKYDLIVKLLKEGRTNREICKIARCSPNEITPIRKTINGENTDTGIDMKDKSICAQVFDLLEKEISLPQIVIKVDIDPEEAMRLQEKYLLVSKRDKIIHLLKDKKRYGFNHRNTRIPTSTPRVLEGNYRNQRPKNHNMGSDGRQGGY